MLNIVEGRLVKYINEYEYHYNLDSLPQRKLPFLGDKWYKIFEKSGTEDTMWTEWFIKYTNDRNLYCVYNNLVQFTNNNHSKLAVNREEIGLHFQ